MKPNTPKIQFIISTYVAYTTLSTTLNKHTTNSLSYFGSYYVDTFFTVGYCCELRVKNASQIPTFHHVLRVFPTVYFVLHKYLYKTTIKNLSLDIFLLSTFLAVFYSRKHIQWKSCTWSLSTIHSPKLMPQKLWFTF